MENASKFLYIATSTMIALMILSMFIYLFMAGAKTNENYDTQKSREQLELANSMLEKYDVGVGSDEALNIMDIISVANLAYSINEMIEYDEQNTVYIEVALSSNKYFKIPNTDEGLSRNQIIYENVSVKKNIPIYDLATSDIFISSPNPEKLSVTRYDNANNKTIYKYLFNCTEMEYDNVTGKIRGMKFEMYENTDF